MKNFSLPRVFATVQAGFLDVRSSESSGLYSCLKNGRFVWPLNYAVQINDVVQTKKIRQC